MDTMLGVYSCIPQDRDHAEKEKRWSQTRCVNFSKEGSLLRTVAGIVECVINDHSNVRVVCLSSCWERRSVREEWLVSPTDSEPLDSEPMPN